MATADDKKWLEVGAVVRIPRDSKRSGRALIVSVDGDEVDLLWEDAAPQARRTVFVVCPRLNGQNGSSDEEEEITLPKENVEKLLSFEKSTDGDTTLSPDLLKSRGDTLLKMGDASSAVPWYEEALLETSQIQVGSTVLLMEQDENEIKILAAEIDCLEDNTADITFVKSGSEAVVTLNAIQLGLSVKYLSLQIRTLLNISRCMLQLAEFDDNPSSRPSLYRQGAIIACSMVLEILSMEESDEDDSLRLITTCYLLRSKAYAGRAKWRAALADIDNHLERKPQSKEGHQWKTELLSLISKSDRANKKLVKSMCGWIQTATANSDEKPVSQPQNAEPPKTVYNRKSDKTFAMTSILVLLVAVVIHN
eukprot:CAMPEP_0178905918 /NCGR_PEP_ID=MMETSP0786-20121207/6542_1 /TAXON_ID=186022 /ORGANISM="Thalassionema frauenfeldii, Strain CCMP 1798" /LENGTH=364 /DNA_ID=CAMNT_0020577579 /DNA_START=27 /DNA_END=1118 /DNA_ORIENTATION=+